MNSNEISKSYLSSPQSLISYMENSKGIWHIKDNESRYIYVNKQVLANLNLPENFQCEGKLDKEIPSKPCAELWEEFVEYDRRVIDESRTISSIVIHYYGKGNTDDPTPIMAEKTPLYDEEGKVVGVVDHHRIIDAPTLLFYMNRLNRKMIQFDAPNDLFTTKELDIIFWAQQRLSAKEIAKRLSLAPRTIENRLSIIYEKAGIHSIIQLVEYCKHTGLDSYIPSDFVRNGIQLME